MTFDSKLLFAAMTASAVLPIVAFATGQIVAAYLVGAVGIAVFIVLSAAAAKQRSAKQKPTQFV